MQNSLVMSRFTFNYRSKQYQTDWNAASSLSGSCVRATAPYINLGYSWYHVPIQQSLGGEFRARNRLAYSRPVFRR